MDKVRVSVVIILPLFFTVTVSYINQTWSDVCAEQWCEKYSVEEVQKMYSGVFMTTEQYSQVDKLFSLSRYNTLQKEGVRDMDFIETLDGDGDSCCVTKHSVYTNLSMNNLLGEPRSVVHLSALSPPSYQFIPHASCLGPALYCDGICVVEPITMSILVYDNKTKTMKFEQFLIPGYCSCKRVLTTT